MTRLNVPAAFRRASVSRRAAANGWSAVRDLRSLWRVGGECVKSRSFPSVREIAAEGACDSFWCGRQKTQLLDWNWSILENKEGHWAWGWAHSKTESDGLFGQLPALPAGPRGCSLAGPKAAAEVVNPRAWGIAQALNPSVCKGLGAPGI